MLHALDISRLKFCSACKLGEFSYLPIKSVTLAWNQAFPPHAGALMKARNKLGYWLHPTSAQKQLSYKIHLWMKHTFLQKVHHEEFDTPHSAVQALSW